MIFNPYVLLGAAGVVIAAFASGAYTGYKYEHRKFEAFKLEVSTLAAKQEAKVESIQKQQALVNKGIENEFQNKLRAVRNYYDGMLRDSRGNQMPALSNAAGKPNESPAYYELAGACAATTVQTIALQDWIKEQLTLK
jgi:hypothetical protein